MFLCQPVVFDERERVPPYVSDPYDDELGALALPSDEPICGRRRTLTLRRAACHCPWGLTVAKSEAGMLLISKVDDKGAAPEHNRRAPLDQRILPNDIIVAINGESDACAVNRTLKAELMVTFELKRTRAESEAGLTGCANPAGMADDSLLRDLVAGIRSRLGNDRAASCAGGSAAPPPVPRCARGVEVVPIGARALRLRRG